MITPTFRRDLDAAAWRFGGVAGCIGLALVEIDDADGLFKHLGETASQHVRAAFHERLKGIVRDPDCLLDTGDHSRALLLPDLLNEHHAALAANRTLAVFDDGLTIDGAPLQLRVRVGIAVAPQPLGEDVPLLEAAAEALTRARDSADAYAVVDASTLDHATPTTINLEERLGRALDNGEFELFFLPTVYARNGFPSGAEALLRWRDPQRGLLRPARFLNFAERTRLIKPITWLTIKAALRQASEWSRLNGPMNVSVNLANAVLADDELVHVVRDALHIWGTPPEQLTLEIRESAAMGDTQHVMSILKPLRRMGVRVAIDDLGAGLSNLAALGDFPADLIKIDRTIISTLATQPHHQAIAQGLVGVAHACGMQVVAEGVSDPQLLARVRDLGCDYAQGFTFSKPLAHDDLLTWLLTQDTASVA